MNHACARFAPLSVLFLLINIQVVFSQNTHEVSPYEGPVAFIKDHDIRYKEEGKNNFRYEVTKPIAVKPGDRLYMRLKDPDNPVRLFLTKYSPMRNYLNAYDSNRFELLRWHSFSQHDTVSVWGETLPKDDYMDTPKVPDSNDNYGLYVMHYRKEKDHYSETAPLFERINYLLNHFYADGAFALESKIDSNDREDTYLLNFSLKTGYFGLGAFDNKPFLFACNRMGWYSADMSKEEVIKELQQWKTEFRSIRNATYSAGGMVAGIQALSYIIPVKQALCKYPDNAICQGNLSEAPGRISIRIVPRIKNENFFIEILVSAI